MPQLNPEFFLSQIFWLFLTFSFLLIFLWKITLPRINIALEKRENKINSDIRAAEKLQTEANLIQDYIDKEINFAKEKVENLIKNSSINFQKESNKKIKLVDEEIINKIHETNISLEKNKQKILNEIDKPIHEIIKLTLSKLSDFDVSEKEINQAKNNIKQGIN